MKRTYEKESTIVVVNYSNNDETISLDKAEYKALYCNGNKRIKSKLSKDLTVPPVKY